MCAGKAASSGEVRSPDSDRDAAFSFGYFSEPAPMLTIGGQAKKSDILNKFITDKHEPEHFQGV